MISEVIPFSIIMPRCTYASEVYGSVFVCVVCLSRLLYSCSGINEVQERVSVGFTGYDLQNNASFSSYGYSFAYIEGRCVAFSDSCVAKSLSYST